MGFSVESVDSLYLRLQAVACSEQILAGMRFVSTEGTEETLMVRPGTTVPERTGVGKNPDLVSDNWHPACMTHPPMSEKAQGDGADLSCS